MCQRRMGRGRMRRQIKSKWLRQKIKVLKSRYVMLKLLLIKPLDSEISKTYYIPCPESPQSITVGATTVHFTPTNIFKAYCQTCPKTMCWFNKTLGHGRLILALAFWAADEDWGVSRALGIGWETGGGGNKRKMPVVPTQLFSQSRSKTSPDWPHRGKLEMCPAFVCCC